MAQRVHFSIRSFDEFVAFLFGDAPRKSFAERRESGETGKKRWVDDVEVTFDSRQICGYYVQLFRHATFLIDRFSKSQLEDGFWAVQGKALSCSAYRTIWNQDLPLPEREECVRAMLPLFSDLFSSEPLVHSVCMWWDSFCYDWHCGNRERSQGGDEMAIQDVIFETLAEVLGLPSQICQGAALHGLSHLHHPGTEEIIQKYLSLHPTLDDQWRDAAIGAARFDLM
jgi:hypothetical protein